MQTRQKLTDRVVMHRRSNGKFGKCLEIRLSAYPVWELS
jgi:hypothetical protein